MYPQGMMGNPMMRAPFMPHGMGRIPVGPRMAGGPMRPMWPGMEEEPVSGGSKRKRRTCIRSRKKPRNDEVTPPPPLPPPHHMVGSSNVSPSFMEDPNAYLAQQTAMLNNTMAGGPGQFSPQGANQHQHNISTRPPSNQEQHQSTSINHPSISSLVAPTSTSSSEGQSIVPLPSTVKIPSRVSKATTVSQNVPVCSTITSSVSPTTNTNIVTCHSPICTTSSTDVISGEKFKIANCSGISSSVDQTTSVSQPQIIACERPSVSCGPSISNANVSPLNTPVSTKYDSNTLKTNQPPVTNSVKQTVSSSQFTHSSSNCATDNSSSTTPCVPPLPENNPSKQQMMQVFEGEKKHPTENVDASNSCSSEKRPLPQHSVTSEVTQPSKEEPVASTEDNSESLAEKSSSPLLFGRPVTSRGTEMLAIRSSVLCASPGGDFEDGDDRSDPEDDSSNHADDANSVDQLKQFDNSESEKNSNLCDNNSRVVSETIKSSLNKTVASSSTTMKASSSPKAPDIVIDDGNKPLSPGPLNSNCSQTPLEMVQNIVSSIPLPPSSHSPLPSAPNNRQQSSFIPSQSASAALQGAPSLYDVRGGIIVQQQTVAVTNSNNNSGVVVVGSAPCSKPSVATLGALPSVQPLVHLVNPFPPATPVIIQQAAGNLGSLGTATICSTASLLPTSGGAFVAPQQQVAVPSQHSPSYSSCSPQLQVAQVVTSDVVSVENSAVSPSGSTSSSSTVSTPHPTPPDLTPSPQSAVTTRSSRRKRRRNDSQPVVSTAASQPIMSAIIMNGRQQPLVMATSHQPVQQFVATASASHQMTHSSGGVTNAGVTSSILAPSHPTSAINVVQMVAPSMAGNLTAAPLQVQPPTILVGSGASPGVLLPRDATFLSTDPNTGLTYPLQIVGVATPQAHHMLAVRPPHTTASKVVNCLSSPTLGAGNAPSAGSLQIYATAPPNHAANLETRNLCPPTAAAFITPEYVTYQQNVFMQQQQQQNSEKTFMVANTSVTTLVGNSHSSAITTMSASSSCPPAVAPAVGNSSSVSISTQTQQQSPGQENSCDVSSTGDIQQCRGSSNISRPLSSGGVPPAAPSLSPNSPSHQSAEVTTTRQDEDQPATPHKTAPPLSESSPPANGEYLPACVCFILFYYYFLFIYYY